MTFEGPEGSGKSTQIQLLYQALKGKGLAVVCTREPGGTPISEQIRAVLHDLENVGMSPEAEVLLYSASRAQHVAQLIRPALERGAVVISDRYAESTLAYQGYGRGLDLDMLKKITAFATGGLCPDLVIYLDLDVQLGLQRKLRDQRQGQGEWNRMDQQDIAFHRRVREGYLRMAEQGRGRWLVVDATQSVEAIHNLVIGRVEECLSQVTDSRKGEPTMALKLIFSIVHSDDADQLTAALRDGGFSSTKISTTGGFLREGNATFLIGTDEVNVPNVLDIIKRNCHTRIQYVNPLPPVMEPGELYMPNPIEVQVGGAVIFVLDVERLVRF